MAGNNYRGFQADGYYSPANISYASNFGEYNRAPEQPTQLPPLESLIAGDGQIGSYRARTSLALNRILNTPSPTPPFSGTESTEFSSPSNYSRVFGTIESTYKRDPTTPDRQTFSAHPRCQRHTYHTTDCADCSRSTRSPQQVIKQYTPLSPTSPPVSPQPRTPTGRPKKGLKGVAGAYPCPCGRSYSRAEHLRRHQKNHLLNLRCSEVGCGRLFHRQDLFSLHKEGHEWEQRKGVPFGIPLEQDGAVKRRNVGFES